MKFSLLCAAVVIFMASPAAIESAQAQGVIVGPRGVEVVPPGYGYRRHPRPEWRYDHPHSYGYGPYGDGRRYPRRPRPYHDYDYPR
jgi:hypothetical protein